MNNIYKELEYSDDDINLSDNYLKIEKQLCEIINDDIDSDPKDNSLNNSPKKNNLNSKKNKKEVIIEDNTRNQKSPTKYNNYKNVIENVKFWASSNNNLDQLIDLYNINKNIWEDKKYINIIKIIICVLTKYCRYDMLNYLRINHLMYCNEEYYKSDFYPFHELIWFNKEINENNKLNLFIKKNYENIIKTFNELLLYGFGYKIFDKKNVLKKSNNEFISENFLETLFNKSNYINNELKDKLYIYFTEKWNDSELMNFILNKILLKENINNYTCEIIYIISKYKNVAIITLINWIIKENNCTNIDKINDLALILSIEYPPSSVFNNYFSFFNMFNFKKDFVNNFISNYDNIIFELIYYKYKQILDINLLIQNSYSNVFKFLGILYSKNNNNKNIIIEIINKIDSNIEFIEYSILQFILNSKIDLFNLSELEAIFISKYLTKNYLNGNIKIKINIFDILSKITDNKLTFSKINALL
jgi:hypothetical protein